MPLYKTLNNRNCTRILVWQVTESESQLFQGIKLSQNSVERLSKMGSALHRRAFLSIRHLLLAAGYNDLQLYYSGEGKPFLEDGTHISITHSFNYTAIIVSSDKVGIDMEKQREKIQRIAPKFIGSERSYLDRFNKTVTALTVIWGAKESMYKLYGTRGLGFKAHCHVTCFDLDNGITKATLEYEDDLLTFDAYFMTMDGFVLVYVLPSI